jgi:hypothetical protein
MVVIKTRKRGDARIQSEEVAEDQVESPKRRREGKKAQTEDTNGSRVTRKSTRKMEVETKAELISEMQEDEESAEDELPPKRTRPPSPAKPPKAQPAPLPVDVKSPKTKPSPLSTPSISREHTPASRGNSMRPGRTHSVRQHAPAARPTFSARIDEDDELPPTDQEELDKIKLPEFSIPSGFKFGPAASAPATTEPTQAPAPVTSTEPPSLFSRLGPPPTVQPPSTLPPPSTSVAPASAPISPFSFKSPAAAAPIAPASTAPEPSSAVESRTVLTTATIEAGPQPSASRLALPAPPSASISPPSELPPTPDVKEGAAAPDQPAPATSAVTSEPAKEAEAVAASAAPASTASAGFSFFKVRRLWV